MNVMLKKNNLFFYLFFYNFYSFSINFKNTINFFKDMGGVIIKQSTVTVLVLTSTIGTTARFVTYKYKKNSNNNILNHKKETPKEKTENNIIETENFINTNENKDEETIRSNNQSQIDIFTNSNNTSVPSSSCGSSVSNYGVMASSTPSSGSLSGSSSFFNGSSGGSSRSYGGTSHNILTIKERFELIEKDIKNIYKQKLNNKEDIYEIKTDLLEKLKRDNNLNFIVNIYNYIHKKFIKEIIDNANKFNISKENKIFIELFKKNTENLFLYSHECILDLLIENTYSYNINYNNYFDLIKVGQRNNENILIEDKKKINNKIKDFINNINIYLTDDINIKYTYVDDFVITFYNNKKKKKEEKKISIKHEIFLNQKVNLDDLFNNKDFLNYMKNYESFQNYKLNNTGNNNNCYLFSMMHLILVHLFKIKEDNNLLEKEKILSELLYEYNLICNIMEEFLKKYHTNNVTNTSEGDIRNDFKKHIENFLSNKDNLNNGITVDLNKEDELNQLISKTISRFFYYNLCFIRGPYYKTYNFYGNNNILDNILGFLSWTNDYLLLKVQLKFIEKIFTISKNGIMISYSYNNELLKENKEFNPYFFEQHNYNNCHFVANVLMNPIEYKKFKTFMNNIQNGINIIGKNKFENIIPYAYNGNLNFLSPLDLISKIP